MAKKIRVLLAEDNSDHQRLLLLALVNAKAPVQVIFASTREELIDTAREEGCDCIVLDFHLGGYDAPEIIAEVRLILPDTPCVVVSANEEQRVVIESLRTGVADFLPKEVAVTGDSLWTAIQTAVHAGRRSRIEHRRTNRRFEAMQRDAQTDPLTGLSNRRAAERVLGDQRNRSDRRSSMSVVMFDIDHFKGINDRLGHSAGDAALRGVAHVLQDEARCNDLVVRWGGEEFLVMRASCSLVEAWAWADRARQRIEKHDVSSDGSGLFLTVSAGVCTVPPAELRAETVNYADRALYAAKDYGRDRVLTWPMARALEMAEEIGVSSDRSVGARVQRLLTRLAEELGPIQRNSAGRHGSSVEAFAMRVGRALGLQGDALIEVCEAARFHDLGKVGVPEEVLSRPGRLSDEEKRLVDQHPCFGADLLNALGASARVCDLVRGQSNRFDADDGNISEQEAMARTVVPLADAFVTMLSNRPYAVTRSLSQVMAEVRFQRGHQFAPAAVDAIQLLDRPMVTAS